MQQSDKSLADGWASPDSSSPVVVALAGSPEIVTRHGVASGRLAAAGAAPDTTRAGWISALLLHTVTPPGPRTANNLPGAATFTPQS